jgi:polysaccharide export outer membrane protein
MTNKRLSLSMLGLGCLLFLAGCSSSAEQLPARSAAETSSSPTGQASQKPEGQYGTLVPEVGENDPRLVALWRERMAASSDPDYEIGPGDVLDIGVPAMDDLKNVEVRVSANNTVDFPLLGVVSVEGLTEQAFRDSLRARLQQYMYNPQVDVFVKEYRSHQVLVVGAVDKPGPYTLASRNDTVLDMISRAGGLKDTAAERALLIPKQTAERRTPSAAEIEASDRPAGSRPPTSTAYRKPVDDVPAAPENVADSVTPITIDLGNLSRNGDRGFAALPARPGDVIIVPHAGEVLVEGWVDKPGSYKITQGLTVLGAVAAAGGAKFAAKEGDIKLVRSTNSGLRQIMHIDLSKIDNGETRDVPVREGDVIVADYSTVKIVPYAMYSVLSRFYLGATTPFF